MKSDFVVKSPPSLTLDCQYVFQLRDGSQVRIQPGPYGKGIAVVPIPTPTPRLPAARRKREPGAPRASQGRRPRPSTVALRERLAQDHKAGKLHDPSQYVKWLIDQDDELGLPQARTVVYRELRQYRTR